jgi:hypothetical protein
VFQYKFKLIYNGKQEISEKCLLHQKTVEQAATGVDIHKGNAANLSFLPNESVDYIYTDPPYGKKIPYLDLSAMWNAWLDIEVSEDDYEHEAIEGGTHNKTKESYNRLIAASICEMFRVLKFDRWLSFVFAHKDPEFWDLIITTAEQVGFEYVGSVPQKNGHSSFKKRQHPFTVLSGELIINFRKVRNPRTLLKAAFGAKTGDLVLNTIEALIAAHNGATLEQINDELIIKGMENGFLDLLAKEYSDLTPLLTENFDYDAAAGKYLLKKNKPFRTYIPVNLRIRYFLHSYLLRTERENTGSARYPTFDEIVLNIMPLLKNGTTPPEQTIQNVLEDIGERVDGEQGHWRLKEARSLFA